MKNVTYDLSGDILTIKVNTKERFGKSKTGKTTIIASTEGNPEIEDSGIFFGLNVYTK